MTFTSWFFFFQAEDGIRDKLVTGVQTCALPICPEDVACRGGHEEQPHAEQAEPSEELDHGELPHRGGQLPDGRGGLRDGRPPPPPAPPPAGPRRRGPRRGTTSRPAGPTPPAGKHHP